MAVRKPAVGNSTLVAQSGTTTQQGQVHVTWKTGPNSYPFDYTVKCVAAASASADALSCSAAETATAVGTVVSGNLPMKHSAIDVTYGGFTNKYVDCYVTATGPHGNKSKCAYAGRGTIPAATTITCDGLAAGDTFTVNSVEYTVVDDLSIVNTAAADLPTVCTSLVTDLSGFNAAFTAVAGTFNGDISTWDVSGVTDFSNMFNGFTAFNADLSNWNTDAATDMAGMFDGATSFNRNLSSWDVAGVTGAALCQDFCANGAGFTAAAQLPAFPGGPPPTCAGTGLGCFP